MFKPEQRPHQSSKPKRSGSQSFSAPRSARSTLIRPVPGQGMMCFKCGNNHRASECDFRGSCRHCGTEGHTGKVCKTNPNSIIKWQVTTPSDPSSAVSTSRGASSAARSSHGSIQMMTSFPAVPPQYPYRTHHFPTHHQVTICPQLHFLCRMPLFSYLHPNCSISAAGFWSFLLGTDNPWDIHHAYSFFFGSSRCRDRYTSG
jgi:hypothetical protein